MPRTAIAITALGLVACQAPPPEPVALSLAPQPRAVCSLDTPPVWADLTETFAQGPHLPRAGKAFGFADLLGRSIRELNPLFCSDPLSPPMPIGYGYWGVTCASARLPAGFNELNLVIDDGEIVSLSSERGRADRHAKSGGTVRTRSAGPTRRSL